MEPLWTPQAILENYPEHVHADGLSRAGYVLAILLVVIAIALFLSTFVVVIDGVSVPVKIWWSATGVYNFHNLPNPPGYTFGLMSGYFFGLITHFFTMTVIFSVIVGSAFLCRRVSGQLLLKRSGAQALNSSEAPIIFLRPFSTDAQAVPPPGFLSFFLRKRWYPEEVFAGAVKGYPLLAIASPGSRLPSIGAAKIYVADSHWQLVVSELCTHARFIFLRVGDTEGILWEIEMLAEQVQRGISVAFLFCGAKGEPISFDDYRSYIANLPQALSSRMPLPDDPTCVRWGYGNPTAGADTPFMVRYAAVTPGSSFIVVVHYEAAALKGGSPSYSLTAGYSPYRVREFQCATLEAMRAVPDIADKSANCDLRKTIDFNLVV